jgi:hypothetical protein
MLAFTAFPRFPDKIFEQRGLIERADVAFQQMVFTMKVIRGDWLLARSEMAL